MGILETRTHTCQVGFGPARAKIAAFVRDRHQQNDDGFPSYAYVHLRKRPRGKTGTSSSSKQEEFVKDFLRPHASQNKQAPLQAPLQALPLQAPPQTQQCVPQTADRHQIQLHALKTQLARAEATRARVLSGMCAARTHGPFTSSASYLP